MKISSAASVFVAAAALAASSAAGDGGILSVSQGWDGVLAPGGAIRYVTLSTGGRTVIAKVQVKGGRVVGFRSVTGNYGIPFVTNSGETGGVSRDGRRLVVASPGFGPTTRLLVLNTKSLKPLQAIVLHGGFSYDALSPDAATLYLIEHTSTQDFTRYRVRAYDLSAGKLLARVIADREEPKEVMRGYPVSRATTADGTWVYTLYAGGKKPFVHALDTRRREAVCLDLTWHGSQNPLWNMRLRLSPDEKQILVLRARGGKVMAIDAPR